MNTEYFNILSIILSCLISHFFPFELLLGAYAFLGPAHYLTEISWLYDRKFFVGNFWVAFTMAAGTGVVIAFPQYWGIYLWSSIALSFAITSSKKKAFRLIVFAVIMSLYFFVYRSHGILSIILMTLLPTIIHVFLFTILFVISGYLKRKDPLTLLTLGMIVLATSSFFLLPLEVQSLFPKWTENNIDYFKNITTSIIEVLGLVNSYRIFFALSKFVAFAYTFHYLNWFAKTELFGWHKTSSNRNRLMLLGYLLFVGIYIYDYKIGLKTLFYLSILHVILEFPLNIITTKKIYSTN